MTTKKPTISVNIKASLIIIHKYTLKLLGNPEYIQILVNPTEKSIVLCRSSADDHLAHHVKNEIFTDSRKSFKINSYALLQGLHKTYPKWGEENTYKITGEFISNLNIIKFCMRDSVVSNRYGGEEYDE